MFFNDVWKRDEMIWDENFFQTSPYSFLVPVERLHIWAVKWSDNPRFSTWIVLASSSKGFGLGDMLSLDQKFISYWVEIISMGHWTRRTFPWIIRGAFSRNSLLKTCVAQYQLEFCSRTLGANKKICFSLNFSRG